MRDTTKTRSPKSTQQMLIWTQWDWGIMDRACTRDERSGHMLPSLTQKLFPTIATCQWKISFFQRESHWGNKLFLRVGPVPRSGCPTQNETSSVFGGSLTHNVKSGLKTAEQTKTPKPQPKPKPSNQPKTTRPQPYRFFSSIWLLVWCFYGILVCANVCISALICFSLALFLVCPFCHIQIKSLLWMHVHDDVCISF